MMPPSSDREAVANFQEKIIRHAALVLDRHCYLDTVSVLLRRRLTRGEASALCETQGRPFFGYDSACRSHPYGLTVHQPTKRALALISHIEPRHIVNRCDIALDLITETSGAAAALREFLAFHVVMPWHGNRQRSERRTILYYSRPRTGRNLALYADQPSKIDGRHTCHLELRLDRARSCRRHGVRRVTDLAAIDLGVLVSRNVRLATLLPLKLDRLLDRIANEQMRKNNYDRVTTRDLIHNYIARAHLQDEVIWPGADWAVTVPVQLFVDRIKPVRTNLKSAVDLRAALASFSAEALFGPL